MFDDSILEPIQKAIWEAKRDYKNVLKIHVTYDFYMRVKAQCAPLVPDIQKPFDYPILGYSVVEHVEPCDKDWWLEIEGEYKPRVQADDCPSCAGSGKKEIGGMLLTCLACDGTGTRR